VRDGCLYFAIVFYDDGYSIIVGHALRCQMSSSSKSIVRLNVLDPDHLLNLHHDVHPIEDYNPVIPA
jgi:hypothetical protein